MLMMFNRLLKNRKGFTLIELMIVVAILGILASLAVASFGDTSSAKARVGKIKGDLRTIESAMLMYKLDNNNTGATIIESLVPSYIKKIPASPATGYSYEISGSSAVLQNVSNELYSVTIGSDTFYASSDNL